MVFKTKNVLLNCPQGERFLFTTEGHVFPIGRQFWKVWEEDEEDALFSKKNR